PLLRTGVALGTLPARNAYARIIRLHPRIHSDRLANREVHERLAHRAIGILGALLTPFSFGKGDLLAGPFGERVERAAVGLRLGLGHTSANENHSPQGRSTCRQDGSSTLV